MSFETAMKRLDEISVQMEQPDITLDNSMKCYKEAVELIAFCRSLQEMCTSLLSF